MSNKTSIAVSGASGFVGTNLIAALKTKGIHAEAIPRDMLSDTTALAKFLSKFNVVMNLAGAPIIKRWSSSYKKIMYDSRINTTRSIVESLLSLSDSTAKTLISTSAVGIYSTEGTHTEASNTMSDDFLGNMARHWEAEALRAEEGNIRTVIFRSGIVLGQNGGALAEMLPIFRLGLGGRIGNGTQPLSWIHLRDHLQAYINAAQDSSYIGSYNLCAPKPVTNAQFTQALARTLNKPAVLPVPEFTLKLLFGQGSSVLTTGQRALPERLTEQGFKFDFEDIEQALNNLLA